MENFKLHELKKNGTQHIPDHNDQWDQSLRTQHQNHPGLSRTRIPVASSVSQRKKKRKLFVKSLCVHRWIKIKKNSVVIVGEKAEIEKEEVGKRTIEAREKKSVATLQEARKVELLLFLGTKKLFLFISFLSEWKREK